MPDYTADKRNGKRMMPEKNRNMAETAREAAKTEVRQKKRKKRRRLYLVPIVIIFISLGVIWLMGQVRPPEQKQPSANQPVPTPTPDTSNSDPDRPTSETGALDGTHTLRDGVYTLLLIGKRDGNTDTLMVAMLDTEKGELNVVSIPRDTVVDVSRRIPKINGAYNDAGGGAAGIEQLRTEMSQIVGYIPGSYACVNMQGFVDLVDAVGGVQFDVPVRMKKLSEGINLQPGSQLLNGDEALQLVRYRGYSSQLMEEVGINHDDYGRMQVQQMFLKALAEQTLTLSNIGKIPEFLKIADQNLETDLSAGNLAWFARQVKDIGTENLHFYTLPTVSVDYSGEDASHGYYENIVHDQAMEMINAYINPYTAPVTDNMVTHRQLG